ncbi:hypothetical protein B0I08_101320 [Glaciihabitans tibetensis]|uniref:Uncharacterized protein n=1 Tax=Glaciihabitans tibetensis TaxID=1266600 RepID=A0A2T0VIZ5_9MICO|nr:hypothetical protein [Glaciihabitans tibetensis]PRY70192.1 hypothetical protein B0I08_101320 [Glaciihabitans tibetensis]
MATITIDGKDFNGTTDDMAGILLVVRKLIEFGEPEWLVLDGTTDEEPVKTVLLITESTKVSAFLDDLQNSDTGSSWTSNVSMLTERFFSSKDDEKPEISN